jgi:copper transport protein
VIGAARRAGRGVFVTALLALVAASPASAHATFVRSTPADRAVLAHAPRDVRVEFDDDVRVGPRNAAVAAGGRSVLQGRARIVGGKTLVLPLDALGEGDYSVRWSIVSDDGHQEEGVLAFAVGTGRAPPVATLTARGTVTWERVLARTLFFLGILAAAGGAVFSLWVLRPLRLDRALLRPQAHVLFFGLLLAFLGSDALIHAADASGTRFERVVEVAATIAAVGGAAAALAPVYPWLLPVAWAAAGLLFLCPTLSGHALDRDQPRVVAALADLVHLGTAAIWFGGLVSLAFVAWRAPDAVRPQIARRFSKLALASVVAIAITGVARALTELSAVSQLWSTSYGRTIIVKTALFAPLVGLGWLNRTLLLDAFARLRRSALVELAILSGVVVAVGVLTDLRPGRVAAAGAPAAEVAPPPARLPPPPAPRAFVDAQELGTLAVALAVKDAKATITVLGADNSGVRGLDVRVDAFRARPCGDGCYRTVATTTPAEVKIGGRALHFDVPVRFRSGAGILRRATRAIATARTLEYAERLASSPEDVAESTVRIVAPDRLSYRIRGGPEGIVIGNRRWDRARRGNWVQTAQTPLRLPVPFWSAASRNAYIVAPRTITFFDPRLPAWFRLRVDTRGRPVEVRMTAAAHFMVQRYAGFDRPVDISPPSR